MPGQQLNLVYPVIGEPIATALAKLVTMFQVIQNDLQPQIIPAEFSWITDLSAQSHALLHLGYLTLDQASIGNLGAGSIYYDGADFWLVTSAGSIKITNGAALNAASVGGITGDYGSSFPSSNVSFNASANEYRFIKSSGVWSDLVCSAVKLQALTGGGSVRLKADDAIAAARTVTLKDIPGSLVHVLTMDSSGNVSPTAAVTAATTISGALTTSGGITNSGSALASSTNIQATGTADFLHAAQWELPQGLAFAGVGGVWALSYTGLQALLVPPGGSGQQAAVWATGLRVGDIIQQATVRVYMQDAGTSHFRIYKQSGGTQTLVSNDVTKTDADSAYHTYTIAFASPYTVATGDVLYLDWTPPASTSHNRLEAWSLFVTH